MDWNNDGKKDLVVVDALGQIWLYINVGTAEKPELAKGTLVEANGKPLITLYPIIQQADEKITVDTSKENGRPAQGFSSIHVADWDSDGLFDLIIGNEREIILYKNMGTQSSPIFQVPVKIEIRGKLPKYPYLYILDWNGDGKRDLLVNGQGPIINFYRNIGTNEEPKLDGEIRIPLVDIGAKLQAGITDIEPMNTSGIAVTDWNNDGKYDIIAGGFYHKENDNSSNAYGCVWLFLGE